MGRSYYSQENINRIISASNANKKRKRNQELINKNCLNKTLDPEFSITNLSFNEETRTTKIEFLKVIHYRTIDRYVQQNYQKYPIYSEWKTKNSTITKTVKLTNSNIETLNQNEDPLLQEFSFEIITRIKSPELIPSWYQRICIESELKQKNHDQEVIQNNAITTYNNFVSNVNKEISKNKTSIALLNKKNVKLDKKINKLRRKEKLILQHHKNLLLSIITFSIYHYLGSNWRLQKTSQKLNNKLNIFKSNETRIAEFNRKINDSNKQLEQNKIVLDTTISNSKSAIEKNLQEYGRNISQIIPLTLSVSDSTDSDFFLLKNLSGMEYKKIIGCYILRNRFNQKCYVGQSKDVFKRIHQHFKGTYPNNIIFAEDYFSTDENIRSDIFELKIIPCKTKDDLDRTEKKLIQEYDSFNTGYNGTNGNQ